MLFFFYIQYRCCNLLLIERILGRDKDVAAARLRDVTAQLELGEKVRKQKNIK